MSQEMEVSRTSRAMTQEGPSRAPEASGPTDSRAPEASGRERWRVRWGMRVAMARNPSANGPRRGRGPTLAHHEFRRPRRNAHRVEGIQV